MKYRESMLIVAVVACVASVGCQPDLEVTLTANASYAVGEDVASTVDITVTNSGSADAVGTDTAPADGYMVDLVLSSDATAPVAFAVLPSPYQFVEDMLVQGGRVSNTDTLAAGAAKTYSGHGGPIPPGTPSPAFLCAVVDPGTKIAESDESNNTSCVEVEITPPAKACVTFETPPLGTEYGKPVPNAPGDLVLTEAGIEVTVENFAWTSGGTFNHARIEASTPDFGIDSQFAWMNNINFEFGFGGLGFVPSKVTFEFEDLGGFENISVNGDPSPIYVGELTAAPAIMGGAAFATSPRVTVPGGYKSVATLTGMVERLRVGGQEFGIDQICAWP